MMKDKRSFDPDELRRRAEEALRQKKAAPPRDPVDDPRKLLHELQVHQIELEMQNEELRQARDEAEGALEKYTDLYDFAPVGYATLDGAGVIRGINLIAASLLGIERSQLVGRSFSHFVAPQGRHLFQAFLESMLTNEDRQMCEVDLLGNAKEALVARLEGFACTSNTECRVSIIDITESRRASDEIARLHRKLERRAYELEVANQELEAFNHTVSHDLRGPLTVIGGYCEFIRESCGEHLDQKCREYLQEVEQGVHRMNDLIETLLKFSSLTRSELQAVPVHLSEMAAAIAVELGKEDPERRATFSIAPGVSAHADPKLLRVVLQNLLGNAWKFTGRKEDALIEFGVAQKEGKSVYFVRDNGPGFDEEHADLLFRAFQRLPGSEDFNGFGIGLATVQRIVELHGGRAWAEGALGKGATFKFTLG